MVKYTGINWESESDEEERPRRRMKKILENVIGSPDDCACFMLKLILLVLLFICSRKIF